MTTPKPFSKRVVSVLSREFISGTVYRVDMDRVDVAPDGSAGILRSLPITGDREKIKPGDPIKIVSIAGERVALTQDVATDLIPQEEEVELPSTTSFDVDQLAGSLPISKASNKLSELTDVDVLSAAPTNDQVLGYNATTKKWVPKSPASGVNASTLSGVDISRFVYGANGSKTTFVQNINDALPSGFYDGYGVTGAPNGAWFHILHQRHDNTNNNYASQLAQQFGTDNLYIRDITEGVPSAWRLMLHEGIHFPRYARSYATIGLQIGTNALSPLPMNGVWLDTGGFWNTSYQTRLTAPVGGVYLCGGGFGIAAAQMTAAARVACFIRKNGSVYYAAGENYSAAGLDVAVSCSGLVDLAAGDYVELVALHTIGATRVVNPGSATYQHGANLWAMKLGG